MSDPRQMYNKATSNNIKLITKNIPRRRRPSCVYVHLPRLGTGSLASGKKQRSFHRCTHSNLDGLLRKVRPPLKKVCFLCSGWSKLWPVGRPQNLFFPSFFFFKENYEILTKKKKKKKKSSHSAVIKSPGRWTGNNIFFKGGLIERACERYLIKGTGPWGD